MLKYIKSKGKKNSAVIWEKAPDIAIRAEKILNKIKFPKSNRKNIFYYRSQNSKAYARARIWGLSKIWQYALEVPPSYIIEVISEKFDHLSNSQKDEVIIHEIAHIPKNFSGSLIPHFRKGKQKFTKKVDSLLNIVYKL